MKTTHQFLDKYPIHPESDRLILGTIHAHNLETFNILFFYGNANSIWKILNESFPNEISATREISLDGILKFLRKYKISVSDTVLECERIFNTALDKDLIPTKLNHNLINQIRNSKIKEILFTSGFGKNNAFKLFYEDILKLKITQEIKVNRGTEISNGIFGRQVKLTILYSPSGTANTGLVNSKDYIANKYKYKDSQRPVHDFKVDYYRQKFNLNK